jgi:quercetin dioxygenase-like cupin family protein
VGPADGASQVELRYFRVRPGGASEHERHPHEHAVVIVHGRAEVLLGDQVHEAGPGDAVFVSANEQHQFRAVGEEPLGFLCAVLVQRGGGQAQEPERLTVEPSRPRD